MKYASARNTMLIIAHWPYCFTNSIVSTFPDSHNSKEEMIVDVGPLKAGTDKDSIASPHHTTSPTRFTMAVFLDITDTRRKKVI